MTPAMAASLTRALFSGAWPREGRVCVYVSYSDETSVDNGNGQYIMAGLAANELYWPTFSERWAREVLNSDPKIPYVHMVDLRSKEWRKKYGLTWDDQLVKVRQAVKIICEEQSVGIFMGSLFEPAYKKFVDDARRQGVRIKGRDASADYVCFVTYFLAILAQITYDVPQVKKISFALSEKKHVTHRIRTESREAIVRYLERESKLGLAKYVGTMFPVTPDDHPPAQAADVVCWHLNRAYAGTLEQEDICNTKALSDKGIVGDEMKPWLITQMGTNLLKEIRERNENKQGIQGIRQYDAATSERSTRRNKNEIGQRESSEKAEES